MNNFDLNTVQETVGSRNHCNGFSIDKIAEFFSKNYEKYHFNSFDEEYFTEKLLWRVSESLRFNVALHTMVMVYAEKAFTKDQLCCIIQAFNGIDISYEYLPFSLKSDLYDYIEYEGKFIYDLGDFDEFKKTIESISPIEFAVFVDLIKEKWGYEGMDDRGISYLINTLKIE